MFYVFSKVDNSVLAITKTLKDAEVLASMAIEPSYIEKKDGYML